MTQIILQQSIHLLLSLFQFNYFRITDGTDKSPMEDHRWRRWADDADFFITDITDGTDYFKTVTSLFDLGFSLFFEKPGSRMNR